MIDMSEPDPINFGDIPAAIDVLLQRGVAAYRSDSSRADRLFREALAAAPDALQVYFCLYKIHTYQGHLAHARSAAENGLREAARQAGWPPDWRQWHSDVVPRHGAEGAARFALYTLKALAFIHLRQDDRPRAEEMLAALRRLDPTGAIGWPVVAALAEGVG